MLTKGKVLHTQSANPPLIMSMEIKLNNTIKAIEEECTLQLLLDTILSGKQNGIAVAINNTVVPKVQWNSYKINSMDDVLIIKATQGG